MSSSSKEDVTDASGILADLWRLMQSVLDDSEQALEALGLSPKAFFLLEAVGDHPFPADLARRMHLPPPTVTYLIKQLEQKSFLKRRAESGDLRRFRLVQTPAGKRALKQGRETLGGILGERLRRLGSEDLASFGRIVGCLAAARDEGSPSSSPTP